MAKISTYPNDSNVTGADKLIGTDANDMNATKNFLMSDIASYVQGVVGVPTLQDVTDSGNVTTLDIKAESYKVYDGNGTGYGRFSLLNNKFSFQNVAGNPVFKATSDSIEIWRGSSSIATISASGVASGITLYLPDANTKTLVASVNGNDADAAGEVTVPAPTLNEVLTAGNMSQLEAGVGVLYLYDIANDYYNYISSTDNSFDFFIHGKTNPTFHVDEGGISVRSASGNVSFTTSLLTGNRTIQAPDANGIMVLTVNGVAPGDDGDVTLPISGSGWALTGNSGTTPGTDFIGTTDAQNVIFKANGIESFKINQTTNDLELKNNLLALNSTANSLSAYNSTNNAFAEIGQNIIGPYFKLSKVGGDGIIRATNLTDSRVYELPDYDGTFVLSVNGTAPDATGNVTLTSTSGWALTGNSGTNPSTDFVGTTDAQDVVFKANAQEYLRLSSASNYIQSSKPIIGLSSTSSYISVAGNLGNGSSGVYWNSTDRGSVYIGKDNSSGIEMVCHNLTDFRSVEMPDASGTLVLSVNGTAPDSSGNVTLAAPYKVWSARVQYSGGNLTVMQQLENTTGATITLSNSFGSDIATASSPIFTSANKAFVMPSAYRGISSLYTVLGYFSSTTVMSIYSYDSTSQAAEDNKPFLLEIRIYP